MLTAWHMPGTTETELTYSTEYSSSVTVLSDDLTKEKKRWML